MLYLFISETSQCFHLFPEASIGMEKKILGNSGLFWNFYDNAFLISRWLVILLEKYHDPNKHLVYNHFFTTNISNIWVNRNLLDKKLNR